jgi:predicted small metal-binding protein
MRFFPLSACFEPSILRVISWKSGACQTAKRITRYTFSFVSEVITMGFSVKCPMCSTQMNAETLDDLMKQGMEHAKTAHGITSIPPAVLAQLQAAVKKT